MLRCVLFDLDRTLLDRDASIEAFAVSQFEKFLPRFGSVDRETYIETFIRLDARGSVWKDEVYQRLVDELAIYSVTWDELFYDFNARVTDFYVPFPDMWETLTALARKYRLGLITNGRTEFQTRTIGALQIASFFSAILISEAEGVRKPELEIFRRALERLDSPPHEAVYVGDHPINDIQAASRAGLKTIWKRNADFSEVVYDAAFDDFSELPMLLRRF